MAEITINLRLRFAWWVRLYLWLVALAARVGLVRDHDRVVRSVARTVKRGIRHGVVR